MKLQTEHYLMIAAAAAGLYIIYSAKQGVKAVAKGLDITSGDNFAASGVNAVGKAVSGNNGWSLGGWIYDVTHPEAADLGKGGPVKVTPAKRTQYK